ncbi:g1811 [Coccomyxa elongata]
MARKEDGESGPHRDGRLRREAPADYLPVLSSGGSAARHPPSIAAASASGSASSCPMAPRGGGGGLPGTEDDEPVDLGWLVEAQDVPGDDPATSAATSDPPLPSDRAIRHMPSFPDIPPAYQQHSLPRPVSAESNFSAAASSPSTYMTQVGPSGRQNPSKPGSMRLITTGLRTSSTPADPPPPVLDSQRSLRSRGAGDSTTGTGLGTAPDSMSPRSHGRMLRSRSGTASVKDEEMQDAGASQIAPDSPGVFRSLRRRPQLNYAQAAGESDTDASSAPKSGEEQKQDPAEPKKSQRGRKRRTEPILVEKEDGTKEEVSPQVYRRLRRRVTNRLSARRMRQKRAEERETIAAETAKLQQENAVLAARMAELEGANRSLAREAYGWRTRYEQLVGPSQQQAQPGAQPRLQGLFPTPTPTAEKRTQSLPVPQPAGGQELQQRSMSPGGFDTFTLAAEYPSLHMLSPQSQQTPLFSRHQQARESQHAPLSLQSFEGGLNTQLSGGGPASQAGMAFFAGMSGLQTAASPGELQSTPEHEQLRSSQAGSQYSLHLRSSPYTITPDLQRLPPHPARGREGGSSSLISPRHFSAPNLSQGAMDLYQHRSHLPSDSPALVSAFGQQGGLESRGSFGLPAGEASGGYAQPGLQQQRASYGQASPRSMHFVRSSSGRASEEDMKRASAPAELQQAQEALIGGHMAYRDGVPSSPTRQHPHWSNRPSGPGS